MEYNIGYIDENPKQVKKFNRALRDHGFNVIGYDIRKGMDIDELIEQVYNSDIDLLMIDYFLKDKGVLTFNGDEVERKYNEIKPNFPHIIFTSHEEDAFNHVDNPNIIYEKEMVTDHRVVRFTEVLKKSIHNYRLYKEKRKIRIEELLQKGEEIGLNAIEKNELLKIQRELNKLDSKSEELPEQLISYEKLDKLSETRKEAEDFLQSLIDKRKNDESKR